MRRLAVFIASCGYIGYVPVGPGTFGSALGLLLVGAVRATGSSAYELSLIVAVFLIGVWSSSEAERHFQRVDPGPIVIDEVFGMLITLVALPINVWGAVVGFLLFRLLDIVKPWPASRFERLPGGLGVMADDGMAAVYGNLIMRVLVWAFPAWLS